MVKKTISSDALVQAAWKDDLPGVKALLAAGADPNAAGQGRRACDMPLNVAAGRGTLEIVKRLLDAGADPNARDGSGWAPLHTAAHNGRAGAVRLLLERGADVRAVNGFGATPLHLSASDEGGEALEVVRLLLAAGADPHAKNDFGLAPQECGKNREARAALRKATGKSASQLALERSQARAKAALPAPAERRIDDACRALTAVTASYERCSTWPPEEEAGVVWYAGRSLDKGFAYLERELGVLAVRSNDDDICTRYGSYDGYQKAPHNWVALPLDKLDWRALPGLLAESHRLAQLPKGGVGAARTKGAKGEPVVVGRQKRAAPTARAAHRVGR